MALASWGRVRAVTRGAGIAAAIAAAACGPPIPDKPAPIVDPSIGPPKPAAEVPSIRLPKEALLAKPEGHLASVTCLAFSSDGRQIVSGSIDSSLLVWDAETGQVVERLEGHDGPVGACAFLPGDKGVVSGGSGGEVFAWDRATGAKRRLGALNEAHDVTSLSVRPDGAEILVGTVYGQVAALSPASGQTTLENNELSSPPEPRRVRAVGYLENGDTFAGTTTGPVVVWSKGLAKGKAKRLEHKASSGLPLPGRRLLLGGEGAVHLIDPAGKASRIGAHQGWVNGLAVSPRHDLLLTGDEGGNARVWNIAYGTLRCELPRGAAIRAAAFDPKGARFAVAGDNGAVVVARARDCFGGRALDPKADPLLRLAAPRGRIRSVAAGALVLLGDSAGSVSAWSTADWSMVGLWPTHQGEVTALAALPDGGWVSGGYDKRIVARSSSPSAPSQDVGKLSAIPRAIEPIGPIEGSSLLTADDSGQVKQLSLTGGPPKRILTEANVLSALAIRPGAPEAAASGAIHGIHRMNLATGADAIAWLKAGRPHEGVTALAYSPDGRWLAEASTHGTVALRDASTGALDPRRFEGLKGRVEALIVTRTHIWAGGTDKTLVRWSLAQDPPGAPHRIDEHAKILGAAATPDGRFLIAALDNGEAAVHSLPGGEPVARLIPVSRDGTFATRFPDGHFNASPTGEAKNLVFEDPTTRKVVALGNLLRLRVTPPTVTRTAEGPVLIKATVFSPRGAPTVKLDGRFTIDGIFPSPTVMAAYEVEILLDDPTASSRSLVAEAPGDEPVRVEFKLEPHLRARDLRPRALVIGNSEYRAVRRLPGVVADVAAMERVLRSPEGWALDGDRIVVRRDLDADTMLKEVDAFFLDKASEGATLLFYYAGHGLTQGGEGFLLPIEHRPGQARGLSASSLWRAVERSGAARVLVVLDACRAGAFALPDTIGQQYEGSKRIGVVTSASVGTDAGETAQGGRFTQALAEAWTSARFVDLETRAVTLGLAYNHAYGQTYAQRPRIFGGLDALQLAWPLIRRERVVLSSAETAGSAAIMRVNHKVLVADSRTVGADGKPDGGVLSVEVSIGHDTEMFRIGVYAMSGKAQEANPDEYFQGPWKSGERPTVTVRLGDLEGGKYIVKVEPCRVGQECGDDPPAKFLIDLPHR